MLEGKMESFCREYILDYNAPRAALRAGYSPSVANSYCYKLLKREDVMERIFTLQEEFVKTALLENKNRVLREYWNMYERAVQAQPVKVWDKELKEYVPTGEYQFDDKIAMKCLEAIAKLGGMLCEKEQEKPAAGTFELVVRVENNEDGA